MYIRVNVPEARPIRPSVSFFDNRIVKKEEKNRAKEMAQSCFDSIKEMMERYQNTDSNNTELIDKIRQEVEETAYSVQVRSDWHTPGDEDFSKPTEYQLELAGGGPAVRIIGDLGSYGDPETAKIEYQDWFTEWQELRLDSEDEDILVDFAKCYYFGN